MTAHQPTFSTGHGGLTGLIRCLDILESFPDFSTWVIVKTEKSRDSGEQ